MASISWHLNRPHEPRRLDFRAYRTYGTPRSLSAWRSSHLRRASARAPMAPSASERKRRRLGSCYQL